MHTEEDELDLREGSHGAGHAAACSGATSDSLQAVCPEEAFSAVLGVMKKYGYEWNPPRNDEITLFVFTFVLINQFHLFFVFCWYEWVTRYACVKNALGGILKQSSKLVTMAGFGAENKIIQK